MSGGQEPDPLEVVLDPSVDEEHADDGPYRGRRRQRPHRRRAPRQGSSSERPHQSGERPPQSGRRPSRQRSRRRWTSAWGTGSVLAAIGFLLVGSGLMVRTLASAQPDVPAPPPSPTASAPGSLADRAVAGDRSNRPGPGSRTSPTPSATTPAGAAEQSPAPATSSPGGQQGSRDPEPGDPEPSDSTEPSLGPQASCHVAVDLERFRDGYTADFTITNLGEPLNGWTMSLVVPDGIRLDEGWNGQWSQDGTTMSVTNVPWNAAVGTGQAVSTGHRAERDGDVSFTGFTLNGAVCTTS